MESRVNKYSTNDNEVLSRTKKNQRLYSEIGDELNKPYDLNSSSVVLENNPKTIDIDKLKDMLDKQYKEEIKNKSLASLDGMSEVSQISLNETREYDINAILSKAKEERKSDYEEDRLKKLRNTQLDILNGLNIENQKHDEEVSISVSKEEGNKLKSLIDTINLTEEINQTKAMDPLDLLSDLKGNNDETKVDGVQELTQEIMKKAQELDTNQIEKVHDELEKELNSDTAKIDNLTKNLKGIMEESNKKDLSKTDSFYTTSSVITKNDFDDFSDLKEDITATKVVVKILIVVVILAFICGVVFLLNQILDWGLF
ncbi:MAG: hypothetical protein E7159_00695 [Firmicutes bacterium]|nr:hypothetical protein [Bacillota bacterium]